MWAHSKLDAILVVLAVGEVALLAAGTVLAPGLPPATTVALGALLVALNCTNFQCIAHNHLHNPFFKNPAANRLFGLINSCALGGPQGLYRVHHLNHHRYGNRPPAPDGSAPGDESSTFRFSRRAGREESFLTYSLLGPFRSNLPGLYRGSGRDKGQVVLEVLAYLAFLIALVVLSPTGFLFFYIPVWYLGQAAAYAENYLEHHRATPGERMRDSVSCYGRLYNLLWFNNGYHQEHHYRPGEHWTTVPRWRSEMLPEKERRVVPGAHLVNLWHRP